MLYLRAGGMLSSLVEDLNVRGDYVFGVTALAAGGTESDLSNEMMLGYAQVAGFVDSDGDGLSDAAEDYSWRRDPELARLDAAPPSQLSFSIFLVSYAEELRHSSHRRRRFAIDTLDGKHIGNCMYYDIDEKKNQAAKNQKGPEKSTIFIPWDSLMVSEFEGTA